MKRNKNSVFGMKRNVYAHFHMQNIVQNSLLAHFYKSSYVISVDFQLLAFCLIIFTKRTSLC